MASGLASEVFLEIGACTNVESGAWGQVYYGGDNTSNYALSPGSSHQGTTTILMRCRGYQQSMSRSGATTGSMQSVGDADVGLVSIELDATDIDTDQLVQAFGAWEEGAGTDTNVVNFHLHCFREYHPNPGRPQEKHHWWTYSGWEGHIVNMSESAGVDGDVLTLVLSADRHRFTDWDGPDGEGKQQIDKSHAKDIKRGMPMT